MKLGVLGFVLLLWFGRIEIAQAQTSIGIRGGYSASNYSYRPQVGRPVVRVGGITEPTYAFVFEQFLNKNAGIQWEFQLIKLGYTQRDTLERVNQTALEYIKIPLLSNFYFGNSGRFHIKMGPHFGYLINANDVRREYEMSNLLPTYGGPEDSPNKIMYGLTAGVGLSKLFGKSTLAADLRFSYEFGRPESQNRVFDMNSTNLELTLSYLLQIIRPRWQK
jgi:hypothetical protein